MGFRQQELECFGGEVAWLDEAEAAIVCADAADVLSRSNYGLDPSKATGIQRLAVDDPPPELEQRLRQWMGATSRRLRLVFDTSEVCSVRTDFFLHNWREMILPSRDDIVILPEEGDWVLYYSHEDEFEYAVRKSKG